MAEPEAQVASPKVKLALAGKGHREYQVRPQVGYIVYGVASCDSVESPFIGCRTGGRSCRRHGVRVGPVQIQLDELFEETVMSLGRFTELSALALRTAFPLGRQSTIDVISVILQSRARRSPLDETFYRRVYIVNFEISDETAEDCVGGPRREGRRKYGEARDIPVDSSVC